MSFGHNCYKKNQVLMCSSTLVQLQKKASRRSRSQVFPHIQTHLRLHNLFKTRLKSGGTDEKLVLAGEFVRGSFTFSHNTNERSVKRTTVELVVNWRSRQKKMETVNQDSVDHIDGIYSCVAHDSLENKTNKRMSAFTRVKKQVT